MGTVERSPAELPAADAVRECVIRERWARDTGQWEAMAGSYYPDTLIAVGWTTCGGTEFIDKTRALAARPRGQGLHQLGPIRVELNGRRAFAELPAQIVMPIELDGVEGQVVVWERMCFRVERRRNDWRIAEFRAVYLNDTVFPDHSDDVLPVDREELASCRRSYRHTQYWSRRAGHGDHPDRPGVDRPDLMNRVYEDNRAWVAEGGR